jgi:hypothetical protein
MMAENKLTQQTREDRDQDSRANTVRPMTWTPPTLLPDPAPQEGWEFRWIRISTQGQNDPSNLSSKLREGWEPCRAQDHPEIQLFVDPASQFKDNIVVGGLMLCKTPSEMVAQRDAWFRKQAESQMQSVDNNFLRESDPRMPLFNERKTSVTFGKGF